MANLTKADFVRILTRFADDPEEVIVEKDTVLCKINGQEISLILEQDEDDVLFCSGDSGRMKARAWIERRLSHLRDLANKILQAIPEDRHFINVGSQQESATGEVGECPKTTDQIFSELQKRPFCTSAIYLLSNAGDGKTMVMNSLARKCAMAFLAGEIHFLFLPIELGGRPFMRFDDLFVGQLAQKYRFRDYYYDAIVELVKLGFLVLGLDGFEEMTVEGKDEKVISTLGELLSQFDSQGKIVISARKAFYEFALNNRTPIGDVMQKHDIEFSHYRLNGWTIKEFETLLASYQIPALDISEIISNLENRLGKNHPIMTRPVLARKLIEYVVEGKDSYANNIDQIGQAGGADSQSMVNQSKVLDTFVQVLLTREATQKWLSKSGKDFNTQLLKTEDHFLVLQSLAEEMWVSRTDLVKGDYLKDWMGLLCEQLGLGVPETRDCKEKILYHAMLRKEGDCYAFCHEAFKDYFLGRQIGNYIVSGQLGAALIQVLDVEILSDAVIDEAAYLLSASGCEFEDVLGALTKARGGLSRISPLVQNIGAILIAFLRKHGKREKCKFTNMYFSKSTMFGLSISDVEFDNCFFENISIRDVDAWQNVCFHRSTIDSLEIKANSCRIQNIVIDEASTPKHVNFRDSDFYAPEQICGRLRALGFTIAGTSSPEADSSFDDTQPGDDLFLTFDRIFKLFSRSYYVTEGLLKVKFSGDWSMVERDMLPDFLKHGLLIESTRQRSGTDRGFKLGFPSSRIVEARKVSNGNFQKFVSELER